jgi:hypothetical protein
VYWLFFRDYGVREATREIQLAEGKLERMKREQAILDALFAEK